MLRERKENKQKELGAYGIATVSVIVNIIKMSTTSIVLENAPIFFFRAGYEIPSKVLCTAVQISTATAAKTAGLTLTLPVFGAITTTPTLANGLQLDPTLLFTKFVDVKSGYIELRLDRTLLDTPTVGLRELRVSFEGTFSAASADGGVPAPPTTFTITYQMILRYHVIRFDDFVMQVPKVFASRQTVRATFNKARRTQELIFGVMSTYPAVFFPRPEPLYSVYSGFDFFGTPKVRYDADEYSADTDLDTREYPLLIGDDRQEVPFEIKFGRDAPFAKSLAVDTLFISSVRAYSRIITLSDFFNLSGYRITNAQAVFVNTSADTDAVVLSTLTATFNTEKTIVTIAKTGTVRLDLTNLGLRLRLSEDADATFEDGVGEKQFKFMPAPLPIAKSPIIAIPFDKRSANSTFSVPLARFFQFSEYISNVEVLASINTALSLSLSTDQKIVRVTIGAAALIAAPSSLTISASSDDGDENLVTSTATFFLSDFVVYDVSEPPRIIVLEEQLPLVSFAANKLFDFFLCNLISRTLDYMKTWMPRPHQKRLPNKK